MERPTDQPEYRALIMLLRDLARRTHDQGEADEAKKLMRQIGHVEPSRAPDNTPAPSPDAQKSSVLEPADEDEDEDETKTDPSA